MKRFPFRPILAGVLFGAALFFVPFFLIRAVLFILLIGAAFRLLGRPWRRGGYGGRRGHNLHWHDGHITPLRGAPTRDVAID